MTLNEVILCHEWKTKTNQEFCGSEKPLVTSCLYSLSSDGQIVALQSDLRLREQPHPMRCGKHKEENDVWPAEEEASTETSCLSVCIFVYGNYLSDRM